MKNNHGFLYLTVFISGMTSLLVEMAASRLLGNTFGTSNLVWACVIGLILIYLTAGYFLGGRLADKYPSPKVFYSILAWASLMVGVVPILSRPVLQISAEAFDQLQLAVLFGSFLAVVILFIFPITLLGTASPFAIRLALEDSRKAGVISGRIYAISTLGSFVGTFLPVLILIPTIGTYQTFIVGSSILMIVSLIGLWRTSRWKGLLPFIWMPLVLVILSLIGLRGTNKLTTGMIYETESAYNYIQVIQMDDYRFLRLNDGQGVHSVYNPNVSNYYGPWEQVLVAPFFNSAAHDMTDVKSMAIIGLAAGTTARQATEVFGPIQIDGFEIDPKIVEVGRTFFDMNEPNLNVIVQDGRWGLEHSTGKYQVISVDAYRPPYIPWHLTTVEFFTLVRAHLTEDGVMVINVGRDQNDRSLINALGSTIASVFPSIYVVDIPNTYNSIIFATNQPTKVGNLAENYIFLTNLGNVPALLLESIQTAITNLQPAPETTQVFTDDLAPIEWITNRMLVNFVLSGEVDELK
jgi:spermidine synthase